MDTIKIKKQYSNFRRQDREYKSICYTPKNLVNLRKDGKQRQLNT